MKPTMLTNDHIRVLDEFTRQMLEGYKSGKIDLTDASLKIGHIYSAIDKGNETEVLNALNLSNFAK